MRARSDPSAAPNLSAALETRAQAACAEADFLAVRSRECERWGLVLEARELRHDARAQRISGLLLMGQAAAWGAPAGPAEF